MFYEPLSDIPIKNIEVDEQIPFIEIVDRILIAKKDNPKADISRWEEELDCLVYQLYSLTVEEVAIVEGKK